MSDAFSVLTVPTVLAALAVGLFVGAIYLPEMRVRTVVGPLSMLVAGESFFMLVTVARYVDEASTWARNIGVGILWVVFCAAMWTGLRIQRWQEERP